jgi:hypothetical protein
VCYYFGFRNDTYGMAATAVSWVAFALSITAVVVSGGVAMLSQRDKARFEARMAYELEARKSLLAVIGPLRYQLLLACRDVVRRVQRLGSGRWDMDIGGYYAQDTVFRMLRPIAITELIERQINYVDFSVDPSMQSLLRFQLDAFECLTGATPVRNVADDGELTGVEWGSQSEHPFKGTLRSAATALIVEDKLLIRGDDFPAVLERGLDSDDGLATIARFFDGFSPNRRPLFWLRLMFYAYVCQQFVAENGKSAGFAAAPYPWSSLLDSARRDDVRALSGVLEARMSAMRTRTLSS